MLTKITALIQTWDDSQKQKDIFAPDERLFAIEGEGFEDCIASQFTLRPGDAAVSVSRGTLLSIRAALIIVEGAPGVDVVINGALLPRELRPPFEDTDTAEDRPKAYYLETCADLDAAVPFVITHGDAGNDDADPVTVRYVLIGDYSE